MKPVSISHYQALVIGQDHRIRELEAENALLKRSLAMLTKQLENRDEADDVDRVRS